MNAARFSRGHHIMIELHSFPPVGIAETASPFGMKLAVWFRLAGIPYRIVSEADPSRGPKGKVPWIVDGDRVIADSSHIVEHYTKTLGIDLDAHLSATERAQALAIQRLVEEHLHWTWVHSLFVTDEGWAMMKPLLRGWVPPIMVPVVGFIMRRNYRRYMHGQGLGRHTDEQIADFGREDVDAVAALLGEKPFVMGDEPSNVDASVGGYFTVILANPYETPISKHAKSHANIVAYVERMRTTVARVTAAKTKTSEALLS
jgi:glutathione S-transferase